MADIVSSYFKEIKDSRGLGKEATQKIAILAKQGDQKALNLLVKNHLLLVAKIARSYAGKGTDLADLIAEGNAGLLKAVEKWKPEGGASFTTCASWRIKQSIIRNCMHNNRIVHLPEHVSELMRTGRIDFVYGEVNIDQPNSEGSTLAESLPDKERNIFENEDHRIRKQKIEKFMANLKPKERLVIKLKFGLEGNDELDIKDIAAQMSLTTTRINQLLRSSMSKMQEQKHNV